MFLDFYIKFIKFLISKNVIHEENLILMTAFFRNDLQSLLEDHECVVNRSRHINDRSSTSLRLTV